MGLRRCSRVTDQATLYPSGFSCNTGTLLKRQPQIRVLRISIKDRLLNAGARPAVRVESSSTVSMQRWLQWLWLTGEVRPLSPLPRRRGSFGFGTHRIMAPAAVGSYGALCRHATLLPVVQMPSTADPPHPSVSQPMRSF
jgi:hypothetical protein